jgi:predicted negative regulator of RcsB-dependent stress response
MRKPLLILVVIALAAVVGYLALDRHDKNVAQERDKAFDKSFAK